MSDLAAPLEAVPKPDEKAYLSTKAEMEESIKGHLAKMDQFGKQLTEVNNEIQKLKSQQEVLLNQARGASSESKAIAEKRATLASQMEKIRNDRTTYSAKLKELREQLPFTSIERIDEEIAALQHRQLSETLNLRQERELIAEIERLNRSRALVDEYHDWEVKLEGVKADLSMLSKELSAVRTEEDAQRKVTDKEFEQLQPFRARRKELTERIGVLKADRTKEYQQVKRIEGEMKALGSAYYAAKHDWYLYQKQQRKIEDAKRLAEKKLRDELNAERRKREALERAQEHPNAAKMAECDSLCAYLRTLLPEETVEAKVAELDVAALEQEGLKVLVKKEEDVDFMSMLAGSKKGKRRQRKKGLAVLHLSFDSLNQLVSLKIDAPRTVEAVPATIEAVEAVKAKLDEEGKKVRDETIAKLKVELAEEEAKTAERARQAEAEKKEAENVEANQE